MPSRSRLRNSRTTSPAAQLAVSFHVAGESGPMTWHAKALTTSYVSAPGAGAKGALEDEAAFPYTTASWFFLDAIEMTAPADAFAIMAFGDSITDGTASTMNGDDRWPNVLSRRLKALHGNKVAVVNGGIGGNQIAGPAEYGPNKPFPGGPASGQRLERDVLSLSGISSLIWLEGINDFSKNGNASADQVHRGDEGRCRAAAREMAEIRVIGATVVSALGSSSAAHGFPEQDAKRKALNEFIRTSGTFDGVIDFDKATLDPAIGRPQAGVRSREHHRRRRRQASPQPHRISGDGPGDRSRSVQAGSRQSQAKMRSPLRHPSHAR